MHFQQQLCINKCTYIKQHLSTQLASYGVYVQLYFILQLARQCIIKVMYLDIGRSIKQSWPLLFLDTYLQCTCYWSAKVISRNTTLIEKNTFHVWLCTNLVVLSGPPRGGEGNWDNVPWTPLCQGPILTNFTIHQSLPRPLLKR